MDAAPPPTPRQPRVVLYGRAGCHLCDDARPVVARVCEEEGEAWVEVDVDEAGLVEEYGELLPVVTVGGVQVAFWRVDEARLRRALAAGPVTG